LFVPGSPTDAAGSTSSEGVTNFDPTNTPVQKNKTINGVKINKVRKEDVLEPEGNIF
jgi:hypothetical protein